MGDTNSEGFAALAIQAGVAFGLYYGVSKMTGNVQYGYAAAGAYAAYIVYGRWKASQVTPMSEKGSVLTGISADAAQSGNKQCTVQ